MTTVVDTELEILRAYADGHELGAIADQLGVKRDRVAEVVSGVSYQRSTAREWVRRHEAATSRPAPILPTPAPAALAPKRPRRQTARPAEGARLVTAAVGEPDADQVVTADRAPSGAVTTAPPGFHWTEPTEIDVQPQPDTIDQVLLRASTHPRLKPKVDRIVGLVAQLRGELAEVAQVAAAEQRVEQLRADLAKATQELKTLTRGPRTGHDDGPDPKEIRTWAARNGVTVPPAGRVPKAVVAQYLAAQAAA